tara:strand:+ start:7483 stop:7638 length:156 start_codon:yes stop_codon:yes gene_type:complete
MEISIAMTDVITALIFSSFNDSDTRHFSYRYDSRFYLFRLSGRKPPSLPIS